MRCVGWGSYQIDQGYLELSCNIGSSSPFSGVLTLGFTPQPPELGYPKIK